MRIVHFCSFPAGKVSGMTNSVMEICEAELELGVDAGICDPNDDKGGKEVKFRRRIVETKPWSWALDKDTVSFISSSPSDIFYELPHKVYVIHGMPQYSMLKQMMENDTSWDTSVAMIRECDAAICWSNFEAEYWRIIYPDRLVHAVERGVDLDYWKPDPDQKQKFRWKPTLVYMDVPRIVKLPFTLLFAVKLAQKQVPLLKLNMFAINEKQATFWASLIAKLNLEIVVENMVVGLVPDPRLYYRGADMVVSPSQHGLMSRVAVEALACGTPVLILQGQEEKVATMKCADSPQTMSKAILELWQRIQKDPEAISEEARGMACAHYDVKDTAKEFIKIAEELT